MPQLNPSPWFFYLLLSWVAFSLIVIPKVLTHTFPESLTLQTKQKPQTELWNWPWS